MRALLIIILLVGIQPAYSIEKCKDDQGKWHYGDVAVAECKNSKVTTLNQRGFITDEKEAPKTAEQIQAEEEEAARIELEKNQREAAAEERRRVLSIYETEDDIDRQRDNQLNSVSRNIDVHNAYLKGMDARVARYESKMAEVKADRAKKKYADQIKTANARIAKSKKERAALVMQKDEIMKKFAKEKEIYRKLKSGEN